ncbi:hypothetical protein FRC06_004825, partial [Ceratobasidium sp. 370]
MVKYVRRLEAMQPQRTVMDKLYGEQAGADEAEMEAARKWIDEDDKRDNDGDSDSNSNSNGDGDGDGDDDGGDSEGGVGNDEGNFGADGEETGQTPILLPSDQFNVWHKATLNHSLLPFAPSQPRHRDVVHVHPVVQDRAGRVKDAGTFDTALFATSCDGFGIARFRAARIRAIFTLPQRLQGLYSDPLVYVDMYSPFIPDITTSHRLYQTTVMHLNGAHTALVLPLDCLAM